jgi:hypothetical protein
MSRTPRALNCKSLPMAIFRALEDFIIDVLHRDVWIKNPDGTDYVGQVWPGFTVTLSLTLFRIEYPTLPPSMSAFVGLPRLVRSEHSRLVDGSVEKLVPNRGPVQRCVPSTLDVPCRLLKVIALWAGIWLDMNEISSFCEGSW